MNNESKKNSSEHGIENTSDNHDDNHDNDQCILCPREIPPSVKDDLFCTPIKCPEKVPTKRFSSPTTSLSPANFEIQKQCIEQINNLLVIVSSPRDKENLTGLRLHFRKLRGILIEVEFDCNGSKENIKGLLKDAGQDYLEIEDIDKKHFIPYHRICMMNSNDCVASEDHGHMELADIDECLRRDLILNFGKVVSANPDLINIFFGIPLYLQIVQFIGCNVIVRTQGESNIIEGKLVDSIKEKICIKTLENVVKEINIIDICNIVV